MMDDPALKEHFVQMIREHQGIINSLCSLYYQHKEDQHDTRQDIILQLWKSFPSFRNQAKESTWIYKVGLHTIFSKLRKEKKWPKSESLEEIKAQNLSIEAPTDDDVQQLKQLIQCLQGLDKAIIVLHLEGYQHKEIASMLELTITNVSTRMNRIKTALRAKYKRGKYELE
ncbi:RNA polymerase sigma factor [Cesiribacter sp. SM1]|uniref:RNA polymerase sigma factor n=1 Tax=Cesiribacter sp. SM1 TaxID=2861196 RepID=UPI001CD2F41A|nr:sigma-70 family RNA polymerase sigma factor [Cesiribacter sp. SM1]